LTTFHWFETKAHEQKLKKSFVFSTHVHKIQIVE